LEDLIIDGFLADGGFFFYFKFKITIS